MAKAAMKSAATKKWTLKPFSSKVNSTWKAAVVNAQKELKARKRNHPALFMLAAVGKHLYEAAQELYEQAEKKSKPTAKKASVRSCAGTLRAGRKEKQADRE